MQAMDTGYGVKGMVLNGNKFLVLLQPDGEYDLPGGRLEKDEGSRKGLRREIFEENGLTNVGITNVRVPWALVSRSGALIKGKTWLCRIAGGEVRLSPEHSSYDWKPLNQLRDLNIYGKYGLDKFGSSLHRSNP